MRRGAVVVVVALVVGVLDACGGSSEGGSGSTGGAAGADGGGSGGAVTGGSGGMGAGGTTGGAGGSGGGAGAPAGGGAGGIDLDGAVLEGSIDVAPCAKPTLDSDCGTFPQCGCELGDKCDVLDLDTGRASCVASGALSKNQACGPFLGQCAAGLACLGGACKPYCAAASDCPGLGQGCEQVELYKSGQSTPVPGMFTCTAGCDPVAPGLVCGAGLTCLFAATGLTDCYGAGVGVGPGACAENQGLLCAPGYTCINTVQQLGVHSCLAWCRLASANDCPSGFVCKELSSKPTLAGSEYGACFSN